MSNKVIVYSQTTCAPCQVVKNFLKSEDVDFTEININEQPEQIELAGITSTPTTVLVDEEGEELVRVHGTDFEAIEELLENL